MREVHSVLVLDDEVEVTARFASELAPRTVFSAQTSAQAMALARDHTFELALVDLWLAYREPTAAGRHQRPEPEWGIDAIRELRRGHPSLVIVLFTGGLSRAFAARAREAGADGALPKLIGVRKALAIIEGGLLTWEGGDEGPVSLARHSYEYLTKVYVDNDRNAAQTARDLAISRDTLYRKLRDGEPR